MASIQHWTIGARPIPAARRARRREPGLRARLHGRARALRRGARVGQWLRIGDARCRVIGVLAQPGSRAASRSTRLVILPVANAQQIFNTSAVFRILVEATSRDSVKAAKRDIIAIIKARHAGTEDITVVTQDALVSTFDTIFGMITAGLAGDRRDQPIVAGVLIMNVMLVAVSQRTRGDRPAKGGRRAQPADHRAVPDRGRVPVAARRRRRASRSATRLVGAHARVYPVLDFAAPPWASASAVGVAIASGLLFGILPARRAARARPRARADESAEPCAAADFLRLDRSVGRRASPAQRSHGARHRHRRRRRSCCSRRSARA